jgi:hypothetical protein
VNAFTGRHQPFLMYRGSGYGNSGSETPDDKVYAFTVR